MPQENFLIPGDMYYIKYSIGVWKSTYFNDKETALLEKRSLIIYVPPSEEDMKKFNNWKMIKQVNPNLSPDLYLAVFEGVKYYLVDLFNEPELIFTKYLPLD
jgi:hypothetical protein